MSRYYDKDELKSKLEIEQVYDLFELWNGEPEYTDFGLIAQTICHNMPGDGSRKLYYYSNTKLCHCYTGCSEPSFDLFDLCIKVIKIQKNLTFELYDAMNYIASYFGFEGIEKQEEKELEDWKILERHQFNRQIQFSKPQLQEFNPIILTRFAYPRISSWEKEGISKEVCGNHLIGYYAGGNQITIPHFDINNRLVGIRGRFLGEDMADKYGKYLPLKVGDVQYSHPLSMNLYGLNRNVQAISRNRLAIVAESEKFVLQYASYYGEENNITVAICGQNFSNYQFQLLYDLGVKEIVIAFDRDFAAIGDSIFQRQKRLLTNIWYKYANKVKISIIFDKNMILPIKASPLDQGQKVFETLLKERIFEI